MNGTMKRENFKQFEKYEQFEKDLAPENCNFSGYSMAMVAGAILLCLGIVIYAILTH